MKSVAATLGPEGFGSYEVDWSGPHPSFKRVIKTPDYLLAPGFVDIHIHGAFGVDFMIASQSDLLHLATKLEAIGYEAFFPTTVTASPSHIMNAVEALPEHPMIPGFHLEGPFISCEFPGAQPQEQIASIPIQRSEWDEILSHPKLKIVTLAPELPNALEFILRLRRSDVLVGMGHTNATYEEARRGYEFGATHTTHTFNAMRGFHHREAGTVGYALANADMYSELIYDRHHVCKEAAALLYHCKSEDRVVAVSDGTLASGMPSGISVEMWGHRCTVEGGTVRLEEGGALAGSAITLLDAFRNLADDFGEELAIRSCCIAPRTLLGWKKQPNVYLEFNRQFELIERRVLHNSEGL